MNVEKNFPSRFIKKKNRYIAVISAFIVAASLLVVLTTFAINMLTATGDLNQMVVQWSGNNSVGDSLLTRYLDTGEKSALNAYYSSKSAQMRAETVIDELMKSQPNENIIFTVFSADETHPNEISGLIRIFRIFSDTEQIQSIKQTWHHLKVNQQKKDEILHTLLSERADTGGSTVTDVKHLNELNRKISHSTRELISANSSILLMLKRYSLWFTVLLGILIVLIGVIYTVRGVKQINQTKRLLHERDYLALFPELNQYPVLNVSANGVLRFINHSAKRLFPSLKKQGLDHEFLSGVKSEVNKKTKNWGTTIIKEIKIGGKYYQQVINFISEEKGIHVHSIDITPLKEEQHKLSKSLEEKNVLLAEIHHRVKNNMAVISGLLELQEMLGESPQAALAESRSRIQSMAIVHELLYKSDSFSAIKAAEFIEKMAGHLHTTSDKIEVTESNVLLENHATININLAVPLGLLINEFGYYLLNQALDVSNHIEVNLILKNEDDRFCLQIDSSSEQLPGDIEAGHSNLRLQLIQKLLKQIDGQLIYPETGRFSVQIIFNNSLQKGSNSAYL